MKCYWCNKVFKRKSTHEKKCEGLKRLNVENIMKWKGQVWVTGAVKVALLIAKDTDDPSAVAVREYEKENKCKLEYDEKTDKVTANPRDL